LIVVAVLIVVVASLLLAPSFAVWFDSSLLQLLYECLLVQSMSRYLCRVDGDDGYVIGVEGMIVTMRWMINVDRLITEGILKSTDDMAT